MSDESEPQAQQVERPMAGDPSQSASTALTGWSAFDVWRQRVHLPAQATARGPEVARTRWVD